MTCRCQNFIDIKTFKKWKAEKYGVKKGEKAKRTKNNAPVFCRCQVESTVERSGKGKGREIGIEQIKYTDPSMNNDFIELDFSFMDKEKL